MSMGAERISSGIHPRPTPCISTLPIKRGQSGKAWFEFGAYIRYKEEALTNADDETDINVDRGA
jgi:hypothetical protein